MKTVVPSRFWLSAFFMLWVGFSTVRTQTLEEGVKLIENQNFSQGRTMLTTVLEKKESAEVYYYLGLSYLEEALLEEDKVESAKILEKAREQFQLAIDKKAKDPFGNAGMGRYLALKGKKAEAEAALTKAQELAGDDVKNVRLMVAMSGGWLALENSKGNQEAAFLLERAIYLDPKQSSLQIALGDVYLKQSIEERPLTFYQKALEADPSNPLAWFRKGQYHLKFKQWDEGGKALKKTIEIDPQYAPAYQEAGELFFRAGQFNAATEYYSKYVALRGEDLSARYRYAQFLYLSKQYTSAVEELKRVYATKQSNLLLRLLAYSTYEIGATKKAAEESRPLYTEAKKHIDDYFSRIDPQNIISRDYEYRGKIRIALGETDLGLQDIYKALEVDETRTALYQEVYKQLVAQKQFEKALGVQVKATEKDPSTQNYYVLGTIYSRVATLTDTTTAATKSAAKAQQIKYFTESLAAFDKVIEKRPTLLLGYLEAARINQFYLDPNTEKGVAKPYFDKVIELGEADKVKYRAELVEAYGYMAVFHYIISKDYRKVLEYSTKQLELDPENTNGKQLKQFADGQLGNR